MRGGVCGAGCATKRLVRSQGIERAEDRRAVDRRMRRHRRKRPRDRLQVLDPAQSATRFRYPGADSLVEFLSAQALDHRAHDPAVLDLGHADIDDLAGITRQPFADGEPGREILQVRRRRHHHRIGDAVEFERDGHFGHPLARDGPAAAVGPDLDHLCHVSPC